MPALHINEDKFEEVVLKADKPVLVDFFAQWCGPCKAAAPILDELAETYKDKLLIVKIDVDQGVLASNYGVMSIPTVIAFKNGKVMELDGKAVRQIGFPGKEGYITLIESILK